MKTDKNFLKFLEYLFMAFHFVVGVVVFIIAFQSYEVTTPILGALIIVGSVPHFLIYIMDPKKSAFLLIGVVGLALGLIAIISNSFDINHICILWGALDICRGLTEIYHSAPHVKHEKYELVDIAVSLGDIVIGALLIAHQAHGLKLHLIYFGIAFVIMGLRHLYVLLFIKKHD